jgi:hypothetical protein
MARSGKELRAGFGDGREKVEGGRKMIWGSGLGQAFTTLSLHYYSSGLLYYYVLSGVTLSLLHSYALSISRVILSLLHCYVVV